MKTKDFIKQMDNLKNVLEEKSKEFDCDEIEIVFKDNNGNFTQINCIEGGYAPELKTNMLILSDCTEDIKAMIMKMLGTPTVNADDIDIGEKISFERVFDDEDH